MPTSYKTPGVYLVEKDAFPGSVVATVEMLEKSQLPMA